MTETVDIMAIRGEEISNALLVDIRQVDALPDHQLIDRVRFKTANPQTDIGNPSHS